MVAASHPSVVVGRAHCPYLIDLSGNHTGRCRLPVTGGAMRVDVGASRTPAGVTLRDALVVRSEVEPYVAAQLGGSRARITVRCPGPPVRIVPYSFADYARIRCTFTRAGQRPNSARITLHGYDGISVAGPEQRDAAHDGLLDHATIAQTKTRVVLDGLRLAPYFRSFAGGTAHDELERRHLIGAVRCPSRITLTPRAHAACSVRVGSEKLSYDLRFDLGRGLVIDDDQSVEVLAVVRERAERYFVHVLPVLDPSFRSGERVHIDCGKGTVALLIPGSDLPCTAYAGGEAFPFVAELTESDGSLTIIPQGGDD